MEAIILIIHLVLALAIIGLVLVQRSEGGGLGIGGGGGGGLATGQGAANALTKATAICATCFFITSLLLGVLAGSTSKSSSILDELDQVSAEEQLDEAGATIDDVIDTIEEETSEAEAPSVPISE